MFYRGRKQNPGSSRELPQKRRQKEERSHGTRSESRTRSRTSWRENNDSDNDGKQSRILFDSSPLYLPKKNSGIKSIEISINKTNERFKTTTSPNENTKSLTLKENKPTSSEEEMFDESKTIGYNNNCIDDNGCNDVRIQAGIMINAHGGRNKDRGGGGGPYQYSRLKEHASTDRLVIKTHS